jgi:hypothetical protein
LFRRSKRGHYPRFFFSNLTLPNLTPNLTLYPRVFLINFAKCKFWSSDQFRRKFRSPKKMPISISWNSISWSFPAKNTKRVLTYHVNKGYQTLQRVLNGVVKQKPLIVIRKKSKRRFWKSKRRFLKVQLRILIFAF